MVFVALIILGDRSTRAAKEEDWSVWFENATEIEFPSFHLRVQDPSQTITAASCIHGTAFLTTGDCSYGGDRTQCFKIEGKGIYAYNKWGEPIQNTQITCTVNTTGFAPGQNIQLAWERDPHHGYSANPYHGAEYISPNNQAWVSLEKRIITPLDRGDRNESSFHFWRMRLQYHSSVSLQGYYVITTLIDTFGVEHWVQRDAYNGWMATGDIGGFAFFLLILHSIVMIGVGIFLNNDAKFLRGAPEGSSAEHAPIISRS
jgi:hypothetical protein